MTVSECYSLGFISKTQGYKGLVIAFLDVDYPEDYRKLDEVYIELNKPVGSFFH
jgi:16S rRNA processing protein RimM